MCFSLKKRSFVGQTPIPPIIRTLFLMSKVCSICAKICLRDACRTPSIAQNENYLYSIAYPLRCGVGVGG